MLRYIYGQDLPNFPVLRATMLRDRADQFKRRLNWDVSVDQNGHEIDEYDAHNPLYVIWQRPVGTHGGSMRFLPTMGPTMIADHFSELTSNIRIESPLIWECTRFCLAPDAGREVAPGLVLGAGEVMENFHLSHFIGVFDARMRRIYSRLGVQPDVIGESGTGRDALGVGLWEMNAEAWAPILQRIGITRAMSRNWLEQSLAVQPSGFRLARSA